MGLLQHLDHDGLNIVCLMLIKHNSPAWSWREPNI
jgi:hypothetical protein